MSGSFVWLATLIAALGSGLVAGVFFAFSTFVMPALARLSPDQGIAAMQSMNVAAINRWFMGALFGTAAVCLVLAADGLLAWEEQSAVLRVGGSASYLLGAMLVTAVHHVPRNDALASVAPGTAGEATLWLRYVSGWTRWNHVRTAASFAAAVAFTVALSAALRRS